MSIWGRVLGGAAGFALGGPIGAILGVMAGSAFDKKKQHAFNFSKISQEQKQQIFTMVNRRVFNLYNKKIGIIGKGSIGKQVAKLARAFSMQVEFIFAQNLKKAQLHKFLKKQDIITLHCPLNKNTKDLIASKELTIMKKSTVIINTARGGIINELALVNAIKKKSFFIRLLFHI